jgi:hypothetical protein
MPKKMKMITRDERRNSICTAPRDPILPVDGFYDSMDLPRASTAQWHQFRLRRKVSHYTPSASGSASG